MLCSISLSASEKLAAVSCSYHVDETFDLTSVSEKFTFHTVGVVVLNVILGQNVMEVKSALDIL